MIRHILKDMDDTCFSHCLLKKKRKDFTFINYVTFFYGANSKANSTKFYLRSTEYPVVTVFFQGGNFIL